MTKNNEKNSMVVDGVHYELAPADYKLVSKILARVRVVKDDKVAQAAAPATTPVAQTKPAPAPTQSRVAPAPAKPVVKEQLTADALKRLFGDDDKNVCVYNIESETFMTPYYNGEKVCWDAGATAIARENKEDFENKFPEFEVVAQVNKQVLQMDYPGRGRSTKGEVKFDKNGEYTVGTLVIRKKGTRELFRLNGAAWFGGIWHGNSADAAGCGAYWIAPDTVAWNANPQAAFAEYAQTARTR